VHSESEIITPKKNNSLKTTLIHFTVAAVAVFVIPWLLSLFTSPKIAEIRQSNPQYNNNSQLEYYKGRVSRVNGEIQPENSQDLVLIQQLDVKPLEGPDKGQTFSIETQVNKLSEATKYKEGDTVVLIKINSDEEDRYFVSERYRLDQLNLALVFFVVLILVLVGVRGVTALAGLVFSILALTNFLIPMILIGQNVVLITFLTGLIIMTISLFLSHGFNKIIVVSLVASGITITLSTLFSIAVVYFTKLTGTGSEDAYQLQFSNATVAINFQGLFLSAMIIGTLGVLDDITTSQAATVNEISRANPKLTSRELYFRGLKVGHEHIISLVNTLGLAYISVALPLLMYYIIYNPQPLWVSFNSENLVEEIVRTIVGSSALLLAVPITTLIAANFLRHDPNKITEDGHQHDHHDHVTEKVEKGKFSLWSDMIKNRFDKKPVKSKELAIFEQKLEPKSTRHEDLFLAKTETDISEKKKIKPEASKEKPEDKDKNSNSSKKNEPKTTTRDPEKPTKKVNIDFEEKPTQLDLSGKKQTSGDDNEPKKRIQL